MIDSRARHISEDDLESYSMHRSMPGADLAALEEHLLVCDLCRSNLEEMDRRIASMKSALRLLQARESHREDQG